MSDSKTEHEKTGWRDKTLKAAGAGYVLGDVAMMVAGNARGEKDVIAAGATWLAGGLGMAHYGNPDIDRQLQIQAAKLERHLKKQGVTIPADVRAQSALLADKTVWGHVEQFMYEHPSELLNGMYALGAAVLLRDGIGKDIGGKNKQYFPHGLNGAEFEKVSTNFWMGALVGAGALLGLLVKEDPNAKKDRQDGKGFIHRAMNAVKEHPLRASGAVYTANNGILAWKTWQDFQKRDGELYGHKRFKPHYASGLQLAAYLFSNAMLYSSSRDQITKKGFADEDIAKLENAAAAVIAAQSPQTQQALLVDISQFMATQKGVVIPVEAIAEHLATRVTEFTNDRMKLAADTVKSFAKSEMHRREEVRTVQPARA